MAASTSGLALAAAWVVLVADAASVRAQDAPRSAAGGAECTLTDPVELGTTTSQGVAVAVAFASPGHGLVLWSTDDEHIASRSIDDAALSAPHATALAHAHQIQVLSAVRSDYIAVGAVPNCIPVGNACFEAHGLRSNGTQTGAPYEHVQDGDEPVLESWAAAPDGVFVAKHGADAPCNVSRYTLGADGAVTSRVVAEHCACMRCAAYSAIASRGDTLLALTEPADDMDDPRTLQVVPGGAHVVRGLPTGAQIDRLVPDEAGAWLVFHVGGAAARVAHLRLDGTFDVRPRVASASPLPPALADVVRGTVDVHGSTITLRRIDATLRAVGSPAVVSREHASRIEATFAWSGTDFVVVYALGEHDGWHVWLRRARCA